MNSDGKIRIASAQYPVEQLIDWDHFRAKLTHWVAEAANNGATLLVFPEYASMELISLFPKDQRGGLRQQLDALQSLLTDYLTMYQTLSTAYQVTLIAASFPVEVSPGRFFNRVHVFTPDGKMFFQDKQIMTRFEREAWHISAGEHAQAIQTPGVNIGILVCYDAEFPLLARRLCEQGAQLLVVPSCTDRLAGFHRVRIGAQARALENQIYVVQSCTVGDAPWSDAIDKNVGAAAVFTPPDIGCPPTGILAEGQLNQPQWIYAELNLSRMARVRTHGQVLNWRDWDTQFRET